MQKRSIGRKLTVFIFTFIIILYVDFQLRTSSVPKGRASGAPPRRAPQEAPAPDRGGARSPATSRGARPRGQRVPRGAPGGQRGPGGAPGGAAALELEDIFLAVKTTGRFHATRLALLLETWVSRTKAHTFIFTDAEDEELQADGFHVVVTSCQADHSQQALSCKMSAEYDGFMASDKRWFCHLDDDNYLNPAALLGLLAAFPPDARVYVGRPSLDQPLAALERLEGNATREVRFWFATGGAGFCLSRRLAEEMAPWASGPRFEQTSATIRLPDDCTVGFIVERLGVSMVTCPLFHSHLEDLMMLSQRSITQQVTLSYGMFENKMNSIEVKGSFSKEEDPSRFRTVHCLLHPLTSWCP